MNSESKAYAGNMNIEIAKVTTTNTTPIGLLDKTT